MELLRRHHLPDLGAAQWLAATPTGRWQAGTGDANAAAALHAMRILAEKCQEQRDANVPDALGREVEISGKQVSMMGPDRRGGWACPPAGPDADCWLEVPEWSIVGPFAWDEAWMYPTPSLPPLPPSDGASFALETDRLLSHFRPASEAIDWSTAHSVAGAVRPPLWGDTIGENEITKVGLRGSRWFASAQVRCEKATPVVLAVSADYRCQVWLNGRLAALADAVPERSEAGYVPLARLWSHRYRAVLDAGVNEVLVACENLSGDTRFSLRFGACTPAGAAPAPTPLGAAQLLRLTPPPAAPATHPAASQPPSRPATKP